jgi:SAM-dependent methyltransferase
MHDWILALKAGQRVLDLCSGAGSFTTAGLACTAVALDEDVHAFDTAAPLEPGPYHRVFGKSDQIPFDAESFDLVICHHGLEHIPAVEKTLSEVNRILKPDGRLVISVPNGYGLCDRIYRYVFEGGGHINRFRREQAVALIEQHAGVRLASWHKLYSSFAYLFRLREALDSNPMSMPERSRALNRLPHFTIGAVQRMLYRGTRRIDRLLGTNLSVYGWALYFDRSAAAAAEESAYLNVCIYCGCGHPAATLDRRSRSTWHCRVCNTMNPFVAPFRNTI